MNRHLVWLAFVAAAAPGAARADCDCESSSWIFRSSLYSHSATTGERVAQYAQPAPSYVRVDDTYLESGYRHNALSIRGAGGSVDHLHVVQTWGQGESIRPYGEWLFPYRPGATPYSAWLAPQAGSTWPYDQQQTPYALAPYYQQQPWQFGPHGQQPYQSQPPYPPQFQPQPQPQPMPHPVPPPPKPGH